MAIDKQLIALLNEFGIKLTTDTKSSLRTRLDERAAKHKGRKRISRLEASALALPTKYVNGALVFQFKMNNYWDVVNSGRKASGVSEEGQAKIAEWSATSGLAEKIRISDLEARKGKQSLSERKGKLKTLKKMPFDRAKKAAGFLVARSLKNKSLEPTHFFDEVIKDGRIEELRQRIEEIIKAEVIIDIRQSYE